MTHWYAVYTRPRSERKVAEGFLKRKIESYCPMEQTSRTWMGRRATGTALFRGYVFVRLKAEQLQEAKRIDGVINLVYWLGRPAVIRDIEIEMLRRFLNVHKEVVVEKTTVDMNMMVTLSEGPRPFKETGAGAMGARLLLPSVGYRLTATATQTQMPAITPQTIIKQRDLLMKTN